MLRTVRVSLLLAVATAVVTTPGSAQLTLEPEFEPTDEELGLLPLLTEQLLSWPTTPNYTDARVFRFDDGRYVVVGNAASDEWTPVPGRTPWSIQMIGLDVAENPPHLLGMSVGRPLFGGRGPGAPIDEVIVEDFDGDGDLDLFVCAPWPGMRRPHTVAFEQPEWITLDQTSVHTPGCPSLAGQGPDDLSPALEEARSRAGIPALVATVISSDSVLAEGVAGVRDVRFEEPATLEDLWHIGSVTKSFTSTLASKLDGDGDFSWQLTLGEVFPEAEGTDFDTVPATALARHISGLPANPDQQWFFSTRASDLPPVDQRREVVGQALAEGPTYPPGSRMLYSNLGYMALGSVLETRLGDPWQVLLRTHVLRPMGLSTAGFGPPGSEEVVDQPRGHVRNADGELVPVPGLDNPAALGPAGTLHMSVRDLARYAQQHLAGERGTNGLLPAEQFQRLHRGGLGDYGFGWVEGVDASGRRLIWHNGSNTAWYAYVGLMPEVDRAFVIVTNGSGDARPAVHALLDELLDQWTPRGSSPKPSSDPLSLPRQTDPKRGPT